MTKYTDDPNFHNSKSQEVSFNDIKENVKDAVDSKFEAAKVKVTNMYNDLTHTIDHSYFNFDQYKVQVNNNVFDYSFLRHGLDLITLGYVTVGEQCLAATQDMYSAVKHLVLKEPVKALDSTLDAAWHLGAAGAFYYTHRNMDKVGITFANSINISEESAESMVHTLQYAGGLLSVIGAIDLYSQYQA